ncbi:MAG: hypothetical protein IBX62_05020 [Coriobacteriia bacterium]|nr:hypothetical protein [Coriobacteriia bacterium]
MSSRLAARVEEVLRPIVGTVLASVSVDVESRRIGKTPSELDYTDLPVLADNLAAALVLVVGKDLADAAARNVRRLA